MVTTLDLGFAQIAMPAAVVGRLVRTPDGGAAIGIFHDSVGEVGRIFLVPRPNGTLVEAFLTATGRAAEDEWRRSVFEPIARNVSAAVKLCGIGV